MYFSHPFKLICLGRWTYHWKASEMFFLMNPKRIGIFGWPKPLSGLKSAQIACSWVWDWNTINKAAWEWKVHVNTHTSSQMIQWRICVLLRHMHVLEVVPGGVCTQHYASDKECPSWTQRAPAEKLLPHIKWTFFSHLCSITVNFCPDRCLHPSPMTIQQGVCGGDNLLRMHTSHSTLRHPRTVNTT